MSTLEVSSFAVNVVDLVLNSLGWMNGKKFLGVSSTKMCLPTQALSPADWQEW